MRALITILLGIICLSGFGQENSVTSLTTQQNQLIKNQMIGLGAWSLGSMITGGQSMLMSNNKDAVYYNSEMHVMWSSVNMAIALTGYLNNRKFSNDFSPQNLLTRNKKMKNALLINSGLDLLYMAAGFLITRNQKLIPNSEQRMGYGNAIMLQGSFLLVFDLAGYYLHKKQNKAIKEITLP